MHLFDLLQCFLQINIKVILSLRPYQHSGTDTGIFTDVANPAREVSFNCVLINAAVSLIALIDISKDTTWSPPVDKASCAAQIALTAPK